MAKDRKCPVCEKEFDQKETARIYGKNSLVCLIGVCSSRCYTERNGIPSSWGTGDLSSVVKSSKIDWNDETIMSMLDVFGKDVVSDPNMKNIKEWLEDYKNKING